MLLKNQLVTKTIEEKNLMKCDALQQAQVIFFSMDGYDVEIVENIVEKDMLKLVVNASFKGEPISVNNPLYYKNPPIMVPDGTKREVIDPVFGFAYEVDNFKEDPEEALKIMIVDTLKLWQH